MKRLRKILGSVYYGMIHLYLRFLFWYPIWFYLSNMDGHLAYMRQRFVLRAVEKRIVRELKKNGIALAHISELFPRETWKELLADANKLAKLPKFRKLIVDKEKEPPETKSDIIIHLLGGYGDTQPFLELDNPFIRFVLSDTIIKAVSGYLKILPKFRMFSLHSTILLPPGAQTVFSQNWHRDPDDTKLVKVFLYLSDVDSKKDGPFIYVRGSQLGGKWRNIFPQKPPMGSYPPEEELEEMVPGRDRLICTGRAGTMIFCDTSGLHRGGHSINKRRIMFAGTYLTQAGLKDHKRNFKIKSGKSKIRALSEIARYSLS